MTSFLCWKTSIGEPYCNPATRGNISVEKAAATREWQSGKGTVRSTGSVSRHKKGAEHMFFDPSGGIAKR
jgi:hypothetical protein